jgi:AraC-like DNA-binding protein
LGLVLPLIILVFNNGYLSANRYLACFLFFISFFVFEDFVLFYSKSLTSIALVTNTHAFFYLIGPFAFFYIRSILRDNSKLSKVDFLHFVLFFICFVGYIPYFFTSWDYKLLIAQNIMSENWDLSQFRLNKIFSHKGDQILNVVHSYFYVISLWYLIRHYKKRGNSAMIHTAQHKLIRNWVFTFAATYTVTIINFTVALANNWLYDDKSVFLDRANGALIFASVVYIVMNMIVMFFPHIMYGLPISVPLKPVGPVLEKVSLNNEILFKETILLPRDDATNNIMKSELQLFTTVYLDIIKAKLESSSQRQAFLNLDFKLSSLSMEADIPAHHLTYFFNEITKISFSDWRNGLRIDHAMELINQGAANTITLQALSLECGFASQSTFTRAFKKGTGNSPSFYVKSLKTGFHN